MLTILILAVLAMIVLVLALLAIVIIGMRQEPPTSELSSLAPRKTAAIARRLLGVSVRKPESYPAENSEPESCIAGHTPSGWPNGQDR
jgi:hypothetical protein